MKQDQKHSSFANSKTLANLFLLAAVLLFVFAKFFSTGSAPWGYLIAFSEAAMVGALADWFAITALFRYPLGIPFPHTAIIPKHKARIANNLGDFICEHFLSTPQVMQKIEQMHISRTTMRWLAKRKNAKWLSGYLLLFAHHALIALRDSRAQTFIQKIAIENLKKISIAKYVASVLELMMADQRHQELLNEILEKLNTWIQDSTVQSVIAEKITEEANRTLHIKKVSEYIGEWGTRRIIALFAKEIEAIALDPHHELRYRFNASVQIFICRLQQDPSFIAKAEEIQHQIIHNPALKRYLTKIWSELLDWLEQDLTKENSLLQKKLETALRQTALHVVQDQALQQLIEERIHTLAPKFIHTYRQRFAKYIADRVNAWEEKELVAQLEKAIGKDLQYIRINGTLVGGAIGIVIHAVGQLF